MGLASLTPACGHCGLPSGGAPFCCTGCALASELAREAGTGHAPWKARLTVSLLLGMTVMMLSLFLYAEDVYGAGGGLGWMRGLYRWASAVLATPVVLLLAPPLARTALGGLRGGRATTELLVVLGAAAAWALSIAGVVRGRPTIYFDAAVSALLLASLGRYLEAVARAGASRLLGPRLALAAAPVLAGEPPTPTAPALVAPGTCLTVGPDQVVPLDAVLIDGPVDVDLAVLTGEPGPVTLRAGDAVPAGAIPLATTLRARAVRPASESTLERLAAQARSLAGGARLTRVADAIAGVLVPLTALLALGAGAWWTTHAGLERGIVVALAVALAACPCTYGAATPLVLWLAMRRLLARGVLVRQAATLEALAGARAIAFDKTGTLTAREQVVREIVLAPAVTRDDALALVAALDAGVRHPIAEALVAAAAHAGVAPAVIADRRVQPGVGVTARDQRGAALALRAASDGSGAVALTRGDVSIARFTLGEVLRPEAPATVASLRALALTPRIMSGDAPARVAPIAASLGVDADGGLSPSAKHALVGDAARTIVVGDGANDVLALAGAIGVAIGEGSSLAQGLAPVVLLQPDLRLVPWAISVARRGVQVARRNLTWSLGYNAVFLALAAGGALRPVWAGVSMLGSSLLVLTSTLASMRDEASAPAPAPTPAAVPAPAHAPAEVVA